MAFNLRLLRRKTKTMNEPKIDTLQDQLKTAIKAAHLKRQPPWQRCQIHLQQNASHPVTKQGSGPSSPPRSAPSSTPRNVSASRWKRHAKNNPSLALGPKKTSPKASTTSIYPERGLAQTRCRTRVVSLFPGKESLQRLVIAVPVEIFEAWVSGESDLKTQNSRKS